MQQRNLLWKISSGRRDISPGEVHVWRTSLEQPEEIIAQLQRHLSADEAARVRRFCFEKDRRHWIVARGLLRSLLGQYLDLKPSLLEFRYNVHGKPFIKHPATGSAFHFNLSHSAGLAVYAFIYTRSVGVDVQYTRRKPKVDCEKMARFQFSLSEYQALCLLPADMREQAFYQCWTRKEAYVKARGRGMSLPLDQFDVAFLPGDRPALLVSREDPGEVARWTFQELTCGADYAGALVVEGRNLLPAYWEWRVN